MGVIRNSSWCGVDMAGGRIGGWRSSVASHFHQTGWMDWHYFLYAGFFAWCCMAWYGMAWLNAWMDGWLGIGWDEMDGDQCIIVFPSFTAEKGAGTE